MSREPFMRFRREPLGMLFIRKRLSSPLWHCAPAEHVEDNGLLFGEYVVLFLTLCRQKTEAQVATAFERFAASSGIICADCLVEYKLARAVLRERLTDQKGRKLWETQRTH